MVIVEVIFGKVVVGWIFEFKSYVENNINGKIKVKMVGIRESSDTFIFIY